MSHFASDTVLANQLCTRTTDEGTAAVARISGFVLLTLSASGPLAWR